MNRRDFLKVGGMFSAGLIFLSNPLKGFVNGPAEYSAGGKTFRGTASGEVYVSEDAGRTWRLHTRLGPEYSISSIFSGRDGQIYLIASYKGHSFHLSLAPDEKYWQLKPLTLATLLNMA